MKQSDIYFEPRFRQHILLAMYLLFERPFPLHYFSHPITAMGRNKITEGELKRLRQRE
jgi:hypothetical protein